MKSSILTEYGMQLLHQTWAQNRFHIYLLSANVGFNIADNVI